jgi:hypothetical protein
MILSIGGFEIEPIRWKSYHAQEQSI